MDRNYVIYQVTCHKFVDRESARLTLACSARLVGVRVGCCDVAAHVAVAVYDGRAPRSSCSSSRRALVLLVVPRRTRVERWRLPKVPWVLSWLSWW